MSPPAPTGSRSLKPRTADDLISEDEYAVDERLPYWAELWPSGRVLADRLARPRSLAGCASWSWARDLRSPRSSPRPVAPSVLATDWYEPAIDVHAPSTPGGWASRSTRCSSTGATRTRAFWPPRRSTWSSPRTCSTRRATPTRSARSWSGCSARWARSWSPIRAVLTPPTFLEALASAGWTHPHPRDGGGRAPGRGGPHRRAPSPHPAAALTDHRRDPLVRTGPRRSTWDADAQSAGRVARPTDFSRILRTFLG